MPEERKIKSKPKTIKTAEYKIKTKNAVPYNVLRNSSVLAKEQFIKKKAEIQKQTNEQVEKPENYAMDTIEEKSERAVYAVANTAYYSAKYAIQNAKEHRQKENIPANDNLRKEAAREYVQNKMIAQRELVQTEEIQSSMSPKQKPLAQEPIKVRQTQIKTREHYVQSRIKPTTTAEVKQIQSRSIKARTTQPTKAIQRQKAVFTSKTTRYTSNNAIKNTVKNTQKRAMQKAAKQAAIRSKQLAQRSVQTAKATAKATVQITAKLAQAIAVSVKALVSAIASIGIWAVMLIVLIIVIIIAALAASPFGIFISEEVTEVGTIPLSQIIAEYNVELTQEIENIELSVEYTEVEVYDNRTDSNIVIAVFAAKTAGAEDDTAEDVVVFDEAKAEKLKDYFRTANTVTYDILSVTNEDGTENTYLTISVDGKSQEELMTEYSLTAKQREAVETLLEHGDAITSSSHSLAITNADVQSIINSLPDSLPQKRKDVVKNAGSLVGKVNYFWGGKSSAIGWDSAWGTMRRVAAAGSPSSGTIRAFGLDCSGFVTWVFNNSGMGMTVGHGTVGQKAASTLVSASTVQAGDLAFLPSYSHVGIVVGQDASGNILVIHCSSGANNVVVSTASSVGFTVFRRPNCY